MESTERTRTDAASGATPSRTRPADVRPGSAWDDWHAAGFEHVQHNEELDDAAIMEAAKAYATVRPFLVGVCANAFEQGALQARGFLA